MSVLIPASNKLNADVAGLTSHVPAPPTAAAPSGTEVLSGFLHGESGQLHYLWDAIPVPVASALATPTNSQPGPHGGLVPALQSLVRPGPTVTPAEAVGPTATRLANTVRTDAVSAATRVRRFLGL